jgi:hypothetical protein
VDICATSCRCWGKTTVDEDEDDAPDAKKHARVAAARDDEVTAVAATDNMLPAVCSLERDDDREED